MRMGFCVHVSPHGGLLHDINKHVLGLCESICSHRQPVIVCYNKRRYADSTSGLANYIDAAECLQELCAHKGLLCDRQTHHSDVFKRHQS